MKTSIITGFDSKYMHVATGLLASLERFGNISDYDLLVLNTGLNESEVADLRKRFEIVKEIRDPGWFINLPEATPAHIKANVTLPFLPELFPGYEKYIWVDADMWIQDWRPEPPRCRTWIETPSHLLPAYFADLENYRLRRYRQWPSQRRTGSWVANRHRRGRSPPVDCDPTPPAGRVKPTDPRNPDRDGSAGASFCGLLPDQPDHRNK